MSCAGHAMEQEILGAVQTSSYWNFFKKVNDTSDTYTLMKVYVSNPITQREAFSRLGDPEGEFVVTTGRLERVRSQRSVSYATA